LRTGVRVCFCGGGCLKLYGSEIFIGRGFWVTVSTRGGGETCRIVVLKAEFSSFRSCLPRNVREICAFAAGMG